MVSIFSCQIPSSAMHQKHNCVHKETENVHHMWCNIFCYCLVRERRAEFMGLGLLLGGEKVILKLGI